MVQLADTRMMGNAMRSDSARETKRDCVSDGPSPPTWCNRIEHAEILRRRAHEIAACVGDQGGGIMTTIAAKI